MSAFSTAEMFSQCWDDVLADMDEYDEPAPVAPLSVETVPVATDAPIAVAKKKGRPKKAA